MTNTPAQALTRAKAKVGHSNQIGSCLAECINPAYNPPLPIRGPWRFGGNGKAWAYNFWLAAVEHGKVVKTSDPTKIPAGALLFHAPRKGATTNGGRAGHVAYKADGGGGQYEISTDQPRNGRWGRVKIADVEKAWGKKLVGYIIVTGDGVRLMPDPVAATPKPAPKPDVAPEDWFGIDLRNLAGFDVVKGAKTIEQRLPAIVNDIATVGRETVCVLELPNPQVKNFTRRMAAIGYKHAGGDLGRHIYVKTAVKVDREKLFNLKPRLAHDDKQGVGVICYPDGPHPVAICTAQLENEDTSGRTQIGQANNLMDQFEGWCDRNGIHPTRRFYALDTNSDDRVRTEVFERRGYRDSFDVAHTAENDSYRSIVKWGGKPTRGKRIDLIAVPKGRPVRRARLRTQNSDLYDHLDQFADIGSL